MMVVTGTGTNMNAVLMLASSTLVQSSWPLLVIPMQWCSPTLGITGQYGSAGSSAVLKISNAICMLLRRSPTVVYCRGSECIKGQGKSQLHGPPPEQTCSRLQLRRQQIR